jgi:carbonic anhydrase/acetyltransferase-like protein (isoleucine patch superfamily)
MNTTEESPYTPLLVESIAPLTKPKRKKPAPKHDFGDGLGKVFAHRHSNGEGWVADTARVGEKVFVGKRAKVYHYATVDDDCAVTDSARVCGTCKIHERTRVGANAFIAGSTVIKRSVISGTARLYGGEIVGSEITENVRISGNPTVTGSHIRGSTFIVGRPEISGSTLAGRGVVVGGRSSIVGSNISGYVRILDAAFILNSVLRQDNSFNRPAKDIALCIKDNAMIAKVDLLSAVILVKGHGTIVGGRVYFSPPMSMSNGITQWNRIECVDALCLPNVDIESWNQFERYNHEDPGQRLGTAAELTRRIDATRFNMDNLVPKRRLAPV